MDLYWEIWKPIIGFEGLYEVSNLGRVRSLRRKIIMSARKRNDGYMSCTLSNGGIVKNKLIHRLVAEAFIPNNEDKPEVNHVDGNKQNNFKNNLQWVTASENQRHSIKIGLRKGSRLQNGGSVLLTEEINNKINSLVSLTGKAKWEIVDELLTKVLNKEE
jgi:hypothetical protein